MTVLRREDVQSSVASWDRCPYRMPSPPILAIVPLIIRRLRGPSPSRIIVAHLFRRPSSPTSPFAGCRAAQTKPASSRAIATAIFGAGLCSAANFPEASTQSLLCPIGNRNHTRRLALAPARECTPDARPVLVIPRDFHQQSSDQGVTGAGDAAAPMLLATRILARHQPEIRHQGAGPTRTG